MTQSQSSLSHEPKVCKTCIIKSACTKDNDSGTLCNKAYCEIEKNITDYLKGSLNERNKITM